MDWVTLIAEIGLQEQAESIGEESDVGCVESELDDLFGDWDSVEGKLSPLEATLISTILSTCLLQLHILARAQLHMSNLSFITTRKKLLTILYETEVELRKTFTFETLFTQAKERAASRKQTNILEDVAIRNADQISTLQMKLRNVEKKKQKELNKRQEVVANLKDQIQELVTVSEIRIRYATLWETARQGQCLIRCDRTENSLKDQLSDIKRKFDTEMRIHEEITSFLTQSKQEFDKQIEDWKEKYASEMDRRKKKLNMLQAMQSEEQIKLRELNELFEEHKREIYDYLKYKEKQRLEAEHDKFLYDMATRIQAWWRGTMVRRGLGPYKRRRKLGKDKKKKK